MYLFTGYLIHDFHLFRSLVLIYIVNAMPTPKSRLVIAYEICKGVTDLDHPRATGLTSPQSAVPKQPHVAAAAVASAGKARTLLAGNLRWAAFLR